MGEFGDSILNTIKKRTTSIAFGTYIFFWSTLHWQGIYATLFVSEENIYEKFGLLKNEYVYTYFFGRHGITDWSYYLGYLAPLVLTIIFIWPLPKFILIHLYRIEQEHKTERLRVKFVEEEKRQNFEIQKIIQESAEVEAKTELSVSRKKAEKVDGTIVWEKDYEKFEKDPAFKGFTQILKAVYEHGGKTIIEGEYSGSLPKFEVKGGVLLVADTLGLIDMIGAKTIKLTDKGKYFASKYPHYAAR